MTSEFTLTPTKKFFDENDYFGLDPANVVLFEQRMIPAVSLEGKIILQDRGKLAMAPGGSPTHSVQDQVVRFKAPESIEKHTGITSPSCRDPVEQHLGSGAFKPSFSLRD